MKTRISLLILLISSFSNSIQAQNNTRGLFLTADDFQKKNITHASTHTRIKLHEFFNKEIIEVKTKDSTYTYFKKDIFGYTDPEGNVYRIFNGKIYTIVNPYEPILIYKISDGPPPKGQTKSYSYYFSKEASSTIFPLAMNNILNEFNDHKEFQKVIEIHFGNSNSLLEYDYIHKMYKINRLFELSKS
ncbi:MAG: hypothetical protein J0L87_00170 [Bacteroidetes bacterium]|nr:hypothetical protein [Bacteroidota bacterium]